MTLSRYALRATAVAAGSVALLWPWLDRGNPWVPFAVAYGAALATLNTIAAYASVKWGENKPTQAFMSAVLGGMVGRMAVMLAAIAAGLVALDLPQVALLSSVMSYYTLFLAFELNVVHRTIRSAAVAR
jgi:hypothetical protein